MNLSPKPVPNNLSPSTPLRRCRVRHEAVLSNRFQLVIVLSILGVVDDIVGCGVTGSARASRRDAARAFGFSRCRSTPLAAPGLYAGLDGDDSDDERDERDEWVCPSESEQGVGAEADEDRE